MYSIKKKPNLGNKENAGCHPPSKRWSSPPCATAVAAAPVPAGRNAPAEAARRGAAAGARSSNGLGTLFSPTAAINPC